MPRQHTFLPAPGIALLILAGLCAGRLPARGADAAPVDPAHDWPAWRGPTRNGLAAPMQDPPLAWSETNQVHWKTPLPGRGHGSPTIVGQRIYLPTSLDGRQLVLALDRATGKMIWQSEVHASQAGAGNHAHSSAASSTVACDGQRLWINFLNNGAVYTTALDLAGKLLWQQKVCDYVTHQGFGASPVLHESLIIVAADHRGGGTIAGLDKRTGKPVWTVERPKIANYTTPAILQAHGQIQLVLGGCNLITSLDPLTGRKIWEIPGSSEECVVTPVTDGARVFTSGGYPRNHTVAVVADGSGQIAWQNTTRAYVPSMMVRDGHLYAVLDAGLAVCWKSDTGAELWKERLGGDFFSSPVMVGTRIYVSNVTGRTFVLEAKPEGCRILAQNQLGDEAFATPTICDSQIFLRVAQRGETRQEYLYCIAHPLSATR